MLEVQRRKTALPWIASPSSEINVSTYETIRTDIENEVGRFGYGASTEEIGQRYAFVTASDARLFYRNLRSQNPRLFQELETEDKFIGHLANLQDGGGGGDESTESIEIFKKRAKGLAVKINEIADSKKTLFRLIVAPTGSGKTAFSKGLFCAGLDELWNKRVIPSRIEWRWSKDHKLTDYVSYCAARDAAMYFVAKLTDLQFEEITDNFPKLMNGTIAELSNLRKDISTCELGDESNWIRRVSDRVRKLNFLKNQEDISKFNRHAISYAKIRFVFSFDGFDAVSSIEAFTPREYSKPVRKLKQFLARGLIYKENSRIFCQDGNAHFLIYIRDSTLLSISSDLKDYRLGKNEVQLRWLCPPSYRSMTAIMVRRLRDESNTHEVKQLISRLLNSLRGNFSDCFSPKVDRPISSVFGWNVRNMKRHIGRLLVLLLNKLSIEDAAFVASIKRSGAGRHVFKYLVKNHHRVQLNRYELDRSLVFQEHSKEVGRRYAVTEYELYDLFFERNFDEELLEEVIRFMDDGSVGDCVFNTFFDDTFAVESDIISVAPILVLSRLSLSNGEMCSGQRVHRLLVTSGLVEDSEAGKQITEFLLGWLMTVGLISASADCVARSPLRNEFYLTKTGIFYLKSGAFTISYLDSCCFSAFWPLSWKDEVEFLHAQGSVEESIVSAVHNSCQLMLHLLQVCEVAKRNCRAAGVRHFNQVSECFEVIASRCDSVIDEGHAILAASKAGIRFGRSGGMAAASLELLEKRE